jgi:hypothetical protein
MTMIPANIYAYVAPVLFGLMTIIPAFAQEQQTPLIPSLLKDGYRIIQMNTHACRSRPTCFFFLLQKEGSYFLCEPSSQPPPGQSPCTKVD